MAVEVFPEIKDSVIFFCDFPKEPGGELLIEEAIESLGKSFEEKARCVVDSILLNNLNLSQEDGRRR